MAPPPPDPAAAHASGGAALPVLAIALGGAAGALLRFGVAHHAAARFPEQPHRATLLVNVLGSFVLGVLVAWIAARPHHWPPALRQGLTVGLLGAFTTYSTFALDALRLHQANQHAAAIGYVLATTLAALAAAAGGFALAAWALPTPTT